jgi:hypothetical protein
MFFNDLFRLGLLWTPAAPAAMANCTKTWRKLESISTVYASAVWWRGTGFGLSNDRACA